MTRSLLALALLVAPAPLWAQASALRVEGAAGAATVALAMHRGHPAYPADALRLLGAEVQPGPDGVRAVLFGDTLVFDTRSPFFFAAGRAQQLVAPVYREGGIVYLPHQFFVEWLPDHYPDHLSLREGVLRVTAPPVVAAGAGARDAGAAASAPAETKAPAAPAKAPVGAGAGEATPAKPPAAETGAAAKTPESNTRVVIIDAGHGGVDPGRPGPHGLKEKAVALAVAKRLAATLRKREGYEIHLTRTRDTLIGLYDRAPMANEWKAGRPAALFVSIHANAVSSRSARGFETFFLSAARTEDERRVAEMENAAVAYEKNGQVGRAEDDLGAILNHLRDDYYQHASNDLAEVIQRHIDVIHPGPNRGVKQAGFVVLVGAFMPAVLVEMAFLSNPREAALLGDAGFQQKMTEALADAIDEFFRTHEHLWAAGNGT